MASQQGVDRELSIGEVVSKTFELYRQEFVNYFVLFLVVEAIYGAVLTALRHSVVTPVPPANATYQQYSAWLSASAGPLITSVAISLLALLVFYPVIYGGAVKMASDQIKKGQVDLKAAVRFGASKLVWMWILGLVVGVIVIIGLVAIVVPGIILIIMFSLVLPVLIVENTDIVKTMSRSRELVGHRWAKTFVVLLVFFIIIAIAGAIASDVGGPFGVASIEVTNILSAFYLPLVPIALTVYYYSNLARMAPAQAGTAPSAAPPGMKFCTNCGTLLELSATFCSKCGAKQPTQA